jgi:transcriptional regulator
MYIPELFEIKDKEILLDFIQKNSFALLISQKDGKLFATHLPFLLDKSAGTQGYLYGHMARANPHWKEIDGEVLVVFSGPHTYISPSWYEEIEVVPTWNYVAVHVYGKFHIINDESDLLKILENLINFYESSFPKPWSMAMAPSGYIHKLLKGIVGFKIEITHIEGKWKISQNQPIERQRKVIAALEKSGTENAVKIAELMKALDDPSTLKTSQRGSA